MLPECVLKWGVFAFAHPKTKMYCVYQYKMFTRSGDYFKRIFRPPDQPSVWLIPQVNFDHQSYSKLFARVSLSDRNLRTLSRISKSVRYIDLQAKTTNNWNLWKLCPSLQFVVDGTLLRIFFFRPYPDNKGLESFLWKPKNSLWHLHSKKKKK